MRKTIKGDYGSIDLVNDKVVDIERGATEQGFIYKNVQAFMDKQGVCYIAELGDEPYTYNDFVSITNGDIAMAQLIFDIVDWQSPETLFDEMVEFGEIE